MKTLQGQQLVQELRKQADQAIKRLWVAVPYIGGPVTIRRILGKRWFETSSVSVRLLTDTTDLSCIDTETIRYFYERGEVKSLAGLHAKIYILDDTCIITSANLTNTAFTKRREIGILCSPYESKDVIKTFSSWWKESKNVDTEKLHKVYSEKRHSTEEKTGVSLPTLYTLPPDPGSFPPNLTKRFLSYDRLVADYNDFAEKYTQIQRIWKNKPVFFEIDGLFDYLYHQAPNTPSNQYGYKKPRRLSQSQQIKEIRRWAIKYKNWNEKHRQGNDIRWRLNRSKTLKRLLSPEKIRHLTKIELNEVFENLNSLRSFPINRTKILNPQNNSLAAVKNALDVLVNGDESLASRMEFCNRIRNLGFTSMNEIIGFTFPEKYPLINKNSNSALRFLGYQIKAY